MNIPRGIRILAVTLAPLGCSISDPQAGETVSTSFTVDNTTVTQGEVIHIQITAGNFGNDPITLSGPGGCYVFFQVREPSRSSVVYNSNNACLGPTTTLVLQPAATEVENFVWDGSGSTGLRLQSGTYELRVGANLLGKTVVGPATLVNVE